MDNNQNQLLSKIASLETKNDLLEAELMYLNEMLVRCGFPEGIKTLKETVEELLAEDPSVSHERPELI
ncbi:MAG: hypothetical protein JSR39_03335 [Verrucomicrobia bacterium]|nr:hypothetical protein [Verrucomicrobiota bacterium]